MNVAPRFGLAYVFIATAIAALAAWLATLLPNAAVIALSVLLVACAVLSNHWGARLWLVFFVALIGCHAVHLLRMIAP